MNRESLKKRLIKIMSDSDYLIPSHEDVFRKTISELLHPLKRLVATKVVAIDMKGIVYGPVVAHKLKLPFVPILKGGKIKNRSKVVKGQLFKDHSGLGKSIEIFKGSIKKGDRVILIDDWFDSGKTGRSAIKLIEKQGAKVVAISVIFNQLNHEDRKFFDDYGYHYIVSLKPKG